MRPPDPSACFVHITVFVCSFVTCLAGDLRCYCNLPRCIAKSYMCKSSASGQCFFMLQRNRVTVQGCTDLLPTHRRSCDYNSRAPISGLLPLLRASDPAVVCCDKNMCNHDDYASQLEGRIEASLRNRTGTPAPPRYWYLPNWQARPAGVTEQEVWLKAAVIGVPIAGGFIMMVLLFIAVRILRQDSKLRRKPSHGGAGDILVAHSAATAVACATAANRGTSGGANSNSSGTWLLKHTGSIV